MAEALLAEVDAGFGAVATSSAAWRSDIHIRAAAFEARRHSRWARLLAYAYSVRRLRPLVQRLCFRLEGGPLHSATVRDLLKSHHGVVVGRYSYGDILRPGLMPPGSRIGAYCSVGSGLIVRRRDHPIDRMSQSPLFYNHALGLTERDTIPEDQDNPLTIGNDVWIGDRVTILSGCRSIGNGAVIAAGAVVTRDVPPYAVTGGVPAKQIRARFPRIIADRLEASRWWDHPLGELLRIAPDLLVPAARISVETLAEIHQIRAGNAAG